MSPEVDITIARPSVGIGDRSDVDRQVEEAPVDLRRLLLVIKLETENDVQREGGEEVRLQTGLILLVGLEELRT